MDDSTIPARGDRGRTNSHAWANGDSGSDSKPDRYASAHTYTCP